jgi:subtilase family serine protease
MEMCETRRLMAGYTPAMIEQAYGINQLTKLTGSGQTIAIVADYNNPQIDSDLRTFDAAYHIKNPPSFKVIDENGKKISPEKVGIVSTSEAATSAISESDLDVEWAHALAPKAKIVLVEDVPGTHFSKTFEMAMRVPGASVVSTSYYDDGVSFTDEDFVTPPHHRPETVVSSSGDTGEYPSESKMAVTTNGPGVNYPTGLADVLSVGGTSLYVSDAAGDYGSETLWSESSEDGGGYGTSSDPQPAYQKNALPDEANREVPDVSFDADPHTGVEIYNSTDGWERYGGTSFSAPAWAALIALVDQGRAAKHEAALSGSSAATILYQLNSSDFNKIGPDEYNQGTGLGTPIANELVPDRINFKIT